MNWNNRYRSETEPAGLERRQLGGARGVGYQHRKEGVTGDWVGSGATSVELMALDSMTNDVIYAGQDDKNAGFTERFSKWGVHRRGL